MTKEEAMRRARRAWKAHLVTLDGSAMEKHYVALWSKYTLLYLNARYQ